MLAYTGITRKCHGCGKKIWIRESQSYRFKRKANGSMKYYCCWSEYNKDRPEREKCTCTDCMLGLRCYEQQRKAIIKYNDERRKKNEESKNCTNSETV